MEGTGEDWDAGGEVYACGESDGVGGIQGERRSGAY